MICGTHYFTTKLKSKIDVIPRSRSNYCCDLISDKLSFLFFHLTLHQALAIWHCTRPWPFGPFPIWHCTFCHLPLYYLHLTFYFHDFVPFAICHCTLCHLTLNLCHLTLYPWQFDIVAFVIWYCTLCHLTLYRLTFDLICHLTFFPLPFDIAPFDHVEIWQPCPLSFYITGPVISYKFLYMTIIRHDHLHQTIAYDIS